MSSALLLKISRNFFKKKHLNLYAPLAVMMNGL